MDIDAAAHRLVNGFSSVPMEWVKLAAKNDGDECFAEPMWSTAFIVNDSVDRDRIEAMLVDTEITDLESARRVNSVYDCHVDESDHQTSVVSDVDDERTVLDEESFIKAVQDEMDENPGQYENIELARSGWRAVGDTGIVAREVDGHLVLGINGAGYSFYGSHWIPLYKALGYAWHDVQPSAPVAQSTRTKSAKSKRKEKRHAKRR